MCIRDSFSPVVKAISVRLVLTLAISKNWRLLQLDISNAFLHGKLNERIVVSQPAGFEDSVHPKRVCLLKKSLYGLKQAPRMWYQRLREYLGSVNFRESYSDPSLFIKNQDGQVIYLFAYVDDLVITGSSEQMMRKEIEEMKKEFAVRELGELSYFLGIQVKRTETDLFLSQQRYLINLLSSCNFTNLKPSSTPMSAQQDLVSADSPISEQSEYRRVIGSLQYLTLTRPDIQFAVNKLAQYMSCPRPSHWTTMKRVLRYLAGTQRIGIRLSKVNDLTLTGYSDSDWGGDKSDRKSQTGVLVYLGNTLVSWISRKQVTVARSSTEAEYRALATAVEEMEAIKSLLGELGVTINDPMKLFCDNKGATFVANNPVCHTKLRHVAMDLCFVRERTEAGKVLISHITGNQQRADILTKALKPVSFQELRVNLVGTFPSG